MNGQSVSIDESLQVLNWITAGATAFLVIWCSAAALKEKYPKRRKALINLGLIGLAGTIVALLSAWVLH